GSLRWSPEKGGQVSAKAVEGGKGGARAALSELSASLVPGEPHPLVREVRASSVNLAYKLGPSAPPPQAAPATSVALPRPSQPAVIRAAHAHAKAAATVLGAAEVPPAARPRAWASILEHAVALRDELVAKAASATDALTPDANVQLNGVRIVVSH